MTCVRPLDTTADDGGWATGGCGTLIASVPAIFTRELATTASNAPRSEFTLLVASGDTGGSIGFRLSGGTLCDLGGGLGAADAAFAELGVGGGPYPELRLTGDAVWANGLTSESGLLLGPRPASGSLGGRTAACFLEPRGSVTGVPHAAQNFLEPMSSAPHFAQWVMDSSMLGHLGRRHKRRSALTVFCAFCEGKARRESHPCRP